MEEWRGCWAGGRWSALRWLRGNPWADVDVSASDLSHLSGSRDGWDQAGDVGDIGQIDGADGGCVEGGRARAPASRKATPRTPRQIRASS